MTSVASLWVDQPAPESPAGAALRVEQITVILRQTAAGQVVEPVSLVAVLKGRRRLRAGALVEPLPVLRSGDVLVIP